MEETRVNEECACSNEECARSDAQGIVEVGGLRIINNRDVSYCPKSVEDWELHGGGENSRPCYTLEDAIDMCKESVAGSNWKLRMVGEYWELKNRIYRLEHTLAKINGGTIEFKPNCEPWMLRDQLLGMKLYATILESRMVAEGINCVDVDALREEK